MTRARPLVLVADALAAFRLYVRPLLEELVASVDEAETAEQTLRLVVEHAPELVLLDVGLDGPALARRIKSERPATRVVLLTGHGEEAYLSATGKTGSDALLPKSQLRSRLAPLVTSLLRATPPGPWDGHERRETDSEHWRGPDRRIPAAGRE